MSGLSVEMGSCEWGCKREISRPQPCFQIDQITTSEDMEIDCLKNILVPLGTLGTPRDTLVPV